MRIDIYHKILCFNNNYHIGDTRDRCTDRNYNYCPESVLECTGAEEIPENTDDGRRILPLSGRSRPEITFKKDDLPEDNYYDG